MRSGAPTQVVPARIMNFVKQRIAQQVRDMTPVESVAAAFLAVASEREMIRGVPEVHNIGTGMPMTVLAFASHWWSEWNASGRLIAGAIPYRPDDVMRYVPELTLETGIAT